MADIKYYQRDRKKWISSEREMKKRFGKKATGRRKE